MGEFIIEQFCSSDHSALLQGAGHAYDSPERPKYSACMVEHMEPTCRTPLRNGEVLIGIVANDQGMIAAETGQLRV